MYTREPGRFQNHKTKGQRQGHRVNKNNKNKTFQAEKSYIGFSLILKNILNMVFICIMATRRNFLRSIILRYTVATLCLLSYPNNVKECSKDTAIARDSSVCCCADVRTHFNRFNQTFNLSLVGVQAVMLVYSSHSLPVGQALS